MKDCAHSQNPVVIANRRYGLQMAIAGAAYIIILALSVHTLKTVSLSPPLRDLVAALPGIPVAAVVLAVLRFIQHVDELQRQIHLEAFAVSAGITAVLFLTYSFLEGVGFPRLSGFWTFASIDVFWALSLPFITRRYKSC